MRTVNLDRFQPPGPQDERDLEREEEIELEKADMKRDMDIDREMDEARKCST